MGSRADRRRRRAERNRILAAQSHGEAANSPSHGQGGSGAGVGAREDNKPTREARLHGSYVRAEESRTAPWVNRHVDMIAKLGACGKLTPAQVDAARLWEEVRLDFIAELGVTGERSCLDISTGGFDAGDGNVEAVRAYYALIKRIGGVHSARLGIEVGKASFARPDDLAGLRRALDAVNA